MSLAEGAVSDDSLSGLTALAGGATDSLGRHGCEVGGELVVERLMG